jgi:hypothetical protein
MEEFFLYGSRFAKQKKLFQAGMNFQIFRFNLVIISKLDI